MKRNPLNRTRPAPVVRVRFMAAVIAAVVVGIAGPLVLVWKQAYIASASVRLEEMTDTVSALNRRIATLQLLRDRLSSNERIERVARTLLGLDYPSSNRIAIIPVRSKKGKRGIAGGVDNLLAIVQKQTVKGGTE
ncbi:MAG: cell division protein FtsL [Chitinispirillaceae bacterium]|nr:cell division protein FtsL [Chitinispirillaceae bacterium]